MRKIVYLFKTEGEPFHFNMKDTLHNEFIMVYAVNPDKPEYKGEYEMHGQRICQLFIDKDFQTASWLWDYYMPALHAGGTTMYKFIE